MCQYITGKKKVEKIRSGPQRTDLSVHIEQCCKCDYLFEQAGM